MDVIWIILLLMRKPQRNLGKVVNELCVEVREEIKLTPCYGTLGD